MAIQDKCGFRIGVDYPQPIIDLARAGETNSKAMKQIRETVLQQSRNSRDGESTLPAHCRPSNDEEIFKFFWLNDESSINQSAIRAN